MQWLTDEITDSQLSGSFLHRLPDGAVGPTFQHLISRSGARSPSGPASATSWLS